MWTELNPAPIEARAAARLTLNRKRKLGGEKSQRVKDALQTPYHWLRNHTKTYNEHWVEEGRPSPYEPFPEKPYFEPLFDVFQAERITLIEKSRDLMISWACVGYFTFEAMRTPQRGIAFQAQKEKKVEQLIKYAKTLYDEQPNWLKEEFPLSKATSQQPALSLEFANGSLIMGLPGGADQVRSYHPWGYFNDETAFQPEAGECYNEALAACQKIICNSSAGPGWFADFKRDIQSYNGDE